MNKILLPVVLIAVLVLTGCACSSQSTSDTQTSTNATSNGTNATSNGTNATNTTNTTTNSSDSNNKTGSTSTQAGTYKHITQEEAQEMMTKSDNHIIVDVRRQDEFDAGHIPGAVLIPNESITSTKPEKLPDLNQTILVYCRTGNRSKQAAQKLADMGYTNVYEFGGITTWQGEIVK